MALDGVPLALAFGAGLAATVNPCGFAMLPSFVSYYLGSSVSEEEGPGRIAEGLVVGLVLTGGFMLVFGSAGVAFAFGAQALVKAIPWVTIALGVALAVLGLWLLAGREMHIPLPGVAATRGPGYRSIFAFGIAYAVGSLSCTLPVLLVVVGSAVATGSPIGVLAVFLAYGLGMATVLMLLCLGTAGFREVVVARIGPLLPHMTRISGGLLLLGGAYVSYYWASLLSGNEESALVRVFQGLQGAAQDLIVAPGQGIWLAAGVALVLGALVLLLVKRAADQGPGAEEKPAARGGIGEGGEVGQEIESQARENVGASRA